MVEGRIKLRLGNLEVEYEGTEDFIREELLELLGELVKIKPISMPEVKSAAISPKDITSSVLSGMEMTTNSIAAKLNCRTGTDLLTAAVTRLSILDGAERMSRQEILEQMRTATHYYKASYSNNLSKYLSTLVRDGVLNEVAKGVYALRAESRKELAKRLAD